MAAQSKEAKARKRETSRQWRARNKKRIAEYNRAYNAANRERILELRKRHTTRGGNALYVQRWKERNPDKVAADNTRERNPIERKRKETKRRTMLAGTGGSFTEAEFKALGDICAYCGVKCVPTADHIIPVSRGGSSFIENIAPACLSCNSSKHNMTGDEYRASPRLARRIARRSREGGTEAPPISPDRKDHPEGRNQTVRPTIAAPDRKENHDATTALGGVASPHR